MSAHQQRGIAETHAGADTHRMAAANTQSSSALATAPLRVSNTQSELQQTTYPLSQKNSQTSLANKSSYADEKGNTSNQIDWARLYAAQNNFETRMHKQAQMVSSVVQDLEVGIGSDIMTISGGDDALSQKPLSTVKTTSIEETPHVKHYTEPLPEEYTRLCPILYDEAHKLALRTLTDQARAVTREEQAVDAMRSTLAQAQHDLTVLTRLREEADAVGAKEAAQRTEGEIVVLVKRGKQQPPLFASTHPQVRTAPVTVFARERARAGAMRAEAGEVSIVRAMPPSFTSAAPTLTSFASGTTRLHTASSRPHSRLAAFAHHHEGQPGHSTMFATSPVGSGTSTGAGTGFGAGMGTSTGIQAHVVGSIGIGTGYGTTTHLHNTVGAYGARHGDVNARTSVLNEVGVRVVSSHGTRSAAGKSGKNNIPENSFVDTYSEILGTVPPQEKASMDGNVTIVAVGPDKGLDTVYHIPLGAAKQQHSSKTQTLRGGTQSVFSGTNGVFPGPGSGALGNAAHVLRAARGEMAEALVWTMPVPEARVHSDAVYEIIGESSDVVPETGASDNDNRESAAEVSNRRGNGTGNPSAGTVTFGDRLGKYRSRRDMRDELVADIDLHQDNVSGWAIAGARELLKPLSLVRKQLEAQGQVRMSDSTSSVARREHDRETLSSASTQVLTTALRPQRTDCRTLLSPVVTGGYSPQKGIFTHQPNPKFLDLSDPNKSRR